MSDKKLPTIFESETSNLVKEGEPTEVVKQVGNKKTFEFMKLGKIPLLIFIVVILFELVVGFKILQTPVPKIKLLEPISGGKIVLLSDKTDVPVGDEVSVDIKVSTGGHVTDGTDVVLNYDPKLLEVSDETFFTPGEIYVDYPVLTIDSKNGVIKLSGISSVDQSGFNGIGVFGTLSFKTKKSGNATISVIFKKDETTESNIIETQTTRDVLAGVYNLDLKIGSKDLEPKEISFTETCAQYTQICVDSSGKQGVQECQGGKLKDNVCSFDPQLTLNCTVCEINK